jgi:lipoyl-dependent peroxiredoxin
VTVAARPAAARTWAARTEAPDGKTSPEELVAAAHASCFAMALALVLRNANTTPDGSGA